MKRCLVLILVCSLAMWGQVNKGKITKKGKLVTGANALAGGPPDYAFASTSTADTTTPLTAIFTSSLSGGDPTTCVGMCQNATAEDTQMPGHIAGTYKYTRITDGASYAPGGKSVGNFTPSGGDNDRTFSYPEGRFLYVNGNGQYVYELAVVNKTFQVVNTGPNPPSVTGLGMSTSWLTETRFYNLNSSTYALQQGDLNLTNGHLVNGSSTITYTTVFNFLTAGNCPGSGSYAAFTPNSKTDIGVSTNDDTFTVGLGRGGQGYIDVVFVYSKTRGPGGGPGCAVTNMATGQQWNFSACAPGSCTGSEPPTATFSDVTGQCWGTNGSTYLGTVNTNGTAVTWVSGTQFTGLNAGDNMSINDVNHVLTTPITSTTATLTVTAGIQTGVSYRAPANGIHNVQGSGDGNYWAASQDGAWTKGGCTGGASGPVVVGHQNGTNQWCANNSTGQCNGHNSEGITHDLHTYFGSGFTIRPYSDVTQITLFSPTAPAQDQHCSWPHNNNGTYDDTLPWVCAGNSVTDTYGGVYTPKWMNNEVYILNPGLPSTQPVKRFGHTFACGSGNGSVYTLCADGIADGFGPGNAIGMARPKGDGFCFVTSMLHALGNDNTGVPRADAFCIYMGN